MSAFDDNIKNILDIRQARDRELATLMESQDDLVSIVLRGHLVIEELLFSAVSAHCVDVQYLKDAKLRFPQMASLLRALDKLPSVPPSVWQALANLNSLRNSLAHVLELSDISIRVARFIESLELPDELPRADNQREQLRQAMHYLFGALSAITAFQAALEELVLHKLRGTLDES